jgi:hypothetical protein
MSHVHGSTELILPKWILLKSWYRFNAIPTNLAISLFTEKKSNAKFIWK